MFKCVVMLKVEPWFLYADSEADALKTCDMYKEKASGVVLGSDLIVKQPELKMSLSQNVTLQLPESTEKVEEPKSNQDDERIQIDMEQASKELEDEFDKLQSEIT